MQHAVIGHSNSNLYSDLLNNKGLKASYKLLKHVQMSIKINFPEHNEVLYCFPGAVTSAEIFQLLKLMA